MAVVSGGDFERSARQLMDGFTALRNEYKALAEQHLNLRRSLEITTQEVSQHRSVGFTPFFPTLWDFMMKNL